MSFSQSSARLFYYLAIGLLILLPISPLAVKTGLLHYSIGLALCAISLVGSFLIQILISIWLLRKPPVSTKRILRKASLIALPPLLVAAVIIRDSADKPMIHDITTDVDDPPSFDFLLDHRGADSNSLAISAVVLREQQRAYPHLRPLITPFTREQAMNKAALVSEQLGWDIAKVDRDSGHLEATYTSRWFGFVDDIVIRIRSHPQGSVTDLRSVSRVGEGDLGANAKRIDAFAEAFIAE